MPEKCHESNLVGQAITLHGVPHEDSWLDVHGANGEFLCTVVPVSSLTMEEIAKHGMRRDADRRKGDSDLRKGAALRLEAASRQDPVTGRIATVAEVAVAELAIAPEDAAADAVPIAAQPVAQLIAFPEPAIMVAVNRSRQKAARRRGPRRPPLAAQETTLPLEA